jgi:hypothetical protein
MGERVGFCATFLLRFESLAVPLALVRELAETARRLSSPLAAVARRGFVVVCRRVFPGAV